MFNDKIERLAEFLNLLFNTTYIIAYLKKRIDEAIWWLGNKAEFSTYWVPLMPDVVTNMGLLVSWLNENEQYYCRIFKDLRSTCFDAVESVGTIASLDEYEAIAMSFSNLPEIDQYKMNRIKNRLRQFYKIVG